MTSHPFFSLQMSASTRIFPNLNGASFSLGWFFYHDEVRLQDDPDDSIDDSIDFRTIPAFCHLYHLAAQGGGIRAPSLASVLGFAYSILATVVL